MHIPLGTPQGHSGDCPDAWALGAWHSQGRAGANRPLGTQVPGVTVGDSTPTWSRGSKCRLGYSGPNTSRRVAPHQLQERHKKSGGAPATIQLNPNV